MRVLGIDPGSLKSGYGLVDEQQGQLTVVDYGVIRTVPDTPLAQRLLLISARLQELIARHAPDEVAVEDVFVAKNAQSSLKLGQARGAILSRCRRRRSRRAGRMRSKGYGHRPTGWGAYTKRYRC